MHSFMDNFHEGGKHSSQIAIHQAELRREEKITDKNIYLFHPYRLTILILTEAHVVVEIVREQTLSR